MIRAVFDSSVVVAACGWGSEPYQCLIHVARRRIRSYATDEIIDEWRSSLKQFEAKGAKFRRSPWPTLELLISLSRIIKAAQLGKQRSRDSGDDMFLACALGAQAKYIVSRDPDLLVLEKPFGIEIVTPRTLLSKLSAE